MKKIGIFIFVLVLAGAGFFYWQNNQQDVRALNKNLPAGVKVTKSIFGFGNEYRVVNKIDGYEFKVPKEWRGVKKIKYIPGSSDEKYVVTSINIEGIEGAGRNIAIDYFKIEKDQNLETLANKIFEDFGLIGNFTQDNINKIEVVKTQESVHLLGDYVYFFKKDAVIYTITGGSEEFIREIISNGKW